MKTIPFLTAAALGFVNPIGYTRSGRPVYPIAGGDGTATATRTFETVESMSARRDELLTEMRSLDEEAETADLEGERQARWDELSAEVTTLDEAIEAKEKRTAFLNRQRVMPGQVERGTEDRTSTSRASGPRIADEDLHDLYAHRRASHNAREEFTLLRDSAMRIVEKERFDAVIERGMSRESAQSRIDHLLRKVDAPDSDLPDAVGGEVARRIVVTGNPVYGRALGKYMLAGGPMGLTSGEMDVLSQGSERALSVGTGSAGGFAVVYALDPTIVPTSNFSVNPYRAIARVETIAGTNEWKAVTSGAITAAYAAEATEASDNAPTLAQPDIIVEKAQAYVPFSIEIGQDWSQLQVEMASLFQDAKDDLEATKFTTGAGHGSTEPKGIITGATSTVTAGGSAAFAIADLYKLWEALPPRFRPRASYLANLFTYDKVRQFDTAGGSGVWALSTLEGQLQEGAGGQAAGAVTARLGVLLGRNGYESTAMDAALTTGQKILVVGDFGRYFVIVDRVGLNIEVVPLVVGTNHRPTGQRGLYMYYRNSSDVLSAAAFRVLVTG